MEWMIMQELHEIAVLSFRTLPLRGSVPGARHGGDRVTKSRQEVKMEKVNEENKFDNKIGKQEEEADMAEEKESPFKNSTFNIFDALFVLVSMGLLVADLVTDMIVTCKYFAGGDTAWGALTLGFILAPSIILQVFSVRWYMVDDNMSAVKWITHICQVGPLHRYVNLFITGMEARRTKDPVDFERLFYQQSDVCMLRLFESFMESAPQVVLQLYIMVATNDENFWTGTSAAVSLFSLCWALGAYSRAHRKVRRDKKIVSWPGLVLQTIWRIGMISSRVMALVLFASVFKAYIFLAVGIHWIGMMIWVHLQKTDFCSNPLEERLFNCVVAIIYVFCFFNLKEGKSRKRVLVFYSIMFIENTALLLVWYHYRTIGEWYNVAGFTIVFGGFGIGVVSMVLYYRYLHPRNDFSLCGPKPEKKPSHSLNTTPSMSPSSSHAALFSPELYRHGHSPSPKQQRHPDENHNKNVDSPLARPLSQNSIYRDSDFDKEHGMPHRSRKVKGESHGMGKGDSAVRKSKSESCVCYSEDETGSIKVNLDKNTAGNTSIVTNASLLASFRYDISGFGADLVQRFDDWRDQSHLTNCTVMSTNSKTGNISRSLGSMVDQSHLSASHCMESVTPAKSQGDTNTPTAFSPDLPQMPEITDSPNKIMTAYEAQQVYDSILGTHQPRRNSKRKLHFDKDSRSASGRARSKSGSAVLQNKPTQNEVGNRSCRDVSGNRGPQRVCVTSKYIQDGSSVGNIGTSGQMSHADKQLHNTLTNVATKDKDTSKVSLRSHKTSIHQANNAALESKSKEVHEDEKRNETEITNSQDLILDAPIDLNGEKPLEDSSGRDLQHVLNERQKDFQNQNKPLIMNVDVNNPCAEVGIGIASPRLRDALAKDLFKAKQKVMSGSSKDEDKANVHSRGIDKAVPVLGYMVDDIVKGNTDSDKLSVTGKHAEEVDVHVVAEKGFDPNADKQMKDSHSFTALNSIDKTNQGHSGDAKQSSTEGKDNGNMVLQKAESSITKQEGRVCTNEIHEEQYNYSPSKAGKLFSSSLSPKAAIFGTSQARFNGSHSPLIGGKAPSGAGGSGHKGYMYARSPAGKANLKRVRSLKGSVPSESPSHRQGSNPTNDGRGEGLTDKVHENDHERTPIANLKGKIKRALSIKSKVPHENTALDSSPSVENQIHVGQEPRMSEKHAETFPGPVVTADKFDKVFGRERPALVENQQIGRKSAMSPQNFVEHPKNMTVRSPVKTGSEPLSLPMAVLSSTVGKENSGYTPVLGNRNTSPQKPCKGSAGPSPQKIGKEHISPCKSNKVHTPGKENRAFAPGAGKGSVSRHDKEKSGSPRGKKPPRRSLGRIPTNLVAETVARFDSPGK